jgi:hypothetical protein
MAKTWDQMTLDEKVEDLHRDVIETMKTVNFWIKEHINSASVASEAANAVKTLEQRLAKLE